MKRSVPSRWGGTYKRRPKPTQEQLDNLAHGQRMLEMGEARDLLNTWHRFKNKEWVRDALARTEKYYGVGAPERIRKYMRQIQDEDFPAHGQ